jgi:hypothetical protein
MGDSGQVVTLFTGEELGFASAFLRSISAEALAMISSQASHNASSSSSINSSRRFQSQNALKKKKKKKEIFVVVNIN